MLFVMHQKILSVFLIAICVSVWSFELFSHGPELQGTEVWNAFVSRFFLVRALFRRESNKGYRRQSFPLLPSYHCSILNSVGYLVKRLCSELNFSLEPFSCSLRAHVTETILLTSVT